MAKNITKIKHRFPFRYLRKIPIFFKRFWPVITLTAVSVLISFLNYEPGTFLIGWDNLHPEFNLWMNLKRALFSVWQEHRSLGLLAGQAHSADLPRILLIYLLKLAHTPDSLLRYLTNFLPLVLGPLGVYLLFYHHLFREKLNAKTTQFASFLGAAYYLLNLNTVQTFFVPFETFTYFYGFLPWILFFTISYLQKPSSARFFALLLTSFFASPSFYVETVFLVFFVSLSPFIIEYFGNHPPKLSSLKTFFGSLLAIITPQLYWLLPVVFFVLTGSHVATEAKINQISSPQTYYRNLEFGNLKDLALLKGYLFNYLDLTVGFKYDYLLSVWRNHLSSPLVTLLGYLHFILILTGLYYSFKKKFSWTGSFISNLFLCYFFLLGGGLLINQTFPVFGELFRSPFTKFSIPLSLTYSFFFAIGTVFVLDLFTYLHSRLTYILTLFTLLTSLVIFSSPIFSGNLLNTQLRLTIPGEYFELFDYMNSQNQSSRIANFPQHSFWGWNYYDWGYRGSGFLWHGLGQPLLDRAFDVWDLSSEKYFEEISQAIYSHDQKSFEAILDKYAVSWILIDNHVISPDGKTDLGTHTLTGFLENSRFVTLEKDFRGQLQLYKVKTQNHPNLISVSTPTSSLKIFADLPARPHTYWTEKNGLLSISKTLTPKTGQTLDIPSLTDTENQLPVRIEYQKTAQTLDIKLTPVTPILFADSRQINLPASPQTISAPVSPENSYILELNNHFFYIQIPDEISEITEYQYLSESYLPSSKPFTAAVYSVNRADYYPLTEMLDKSTPVQCYTQKPHRKIEKITSPLGIALLGTDVNGCLSVPLPSIPASSLISYSFTYYSPNLLTANVNLSGKDFISQTPSQPLEPSQTPRKATLFAHSTGKYQQLNLVLEAEGSTGIQEINYQDIAVNILPQIFSTSVSLNSIKAQSLQLADRTQRLQISLPLTATIYDIIQTPKANSLLPESRNCDRFNQGKTQKSITDAGFFYQSQNAIECDQLSLRHLPHSLNYLLSFSVEHQKGLTLTTCLENYSTRRCDVFERLLDTDLIQSIIQPVSNSQETSGYTLHLFNESIGRQFSDNLLKALSVRPIPLRFITSLSLSDSSPLSSELPALDSSQRHSEYLYSLKVSSTAAGQSKSQLNFYQTHSNFWEAIVVPDSFMTLPRWQIPFRLLLSYPRLTKLTRLSSGHWYNTWELPQANQNLFLIYLPQYLQFFGTGLLLITLITTLFLAIKKPLPKERSKN